MYKNTHRNLFIIGDSRREKHNISCKQEALLWQRDRTTRLSVEILQLQNISFENQSRKPIVGDEILPLAIFIQYRSVTDTHTNTDKQTNGQTHDDGMYHA